MPAGLSLVGRRALLRLLAAGREARLVPDTREVQPHAGASLTAADHDPNALDDVAGAEYLDDRIRFQE